MLFYWQIKELEAPEEAPAAKKWSGQANDVREITVTKIFRTMPSRMLENAPLQDWITFDSTYYTIFASPNSL